MGKNNNKIKKEEKKEEEKGKEKKHQCRRLVGSLDTLDYLMEKKTSAEVWLSL